MRIERYIIMNTITKNYTDSSDIINYVVDNLSDGLQDILRKHKCIIAGGSVTSAFTQTDINDVDVYFRSKESLVEAMKEMTNKDFFKYNAGYIIKYVSEKAVLFIDLDTRQDVQFIYQDFYDSPSAIFHNFDFTVNMGAIVLGYDIEDDILVMTEDFVKHNLQRKLVLNKNTLYPVISALRVNKYKAKNYEMSGIEYLKLMLCISALELNTWEDFKEQLGGVYGLQNDYVLEGLFSIDFALGMLENAYEVNGVISGIKHKRLHQLDEVVYLETFKELVEVLEKKL